MDNLISQDRSMLWGVPLPEGNARDTAYHYITGKIIRMEYKPGKALSDKSIAEELSMSRTPVREALILLAFNNMVVIKPQSGTFVAPISLERTAMEQFKRYALEKEIISRACAKLTPEITRRYRSNLEQSEKALESGCTDKDILHTLDNEFHHIAFSAVGMDELYYEMYYNMQHIERFRMLSLGVRGWSDICTEHRQIANAIIDGNHTAAMFYIDRHLSHYREEIDLIQSSFPEYFKMG